MLTEQERTSWRSLYRAHFCYVYRLAVALGVERAEVEDIAQRVFLVVHDKLPGAGVIGNPTAWLRAITVRVVSDHRRWRVVRRVKSWLVQSTTEAGQATPRGPEESTAAAQTGSRVHAVLSQMTPKLRDVLVLLEVEECSLEEAATMLGVPQNTVRSRKRLARAQFLRIWGEPRETAEQGSHV